MRPKHNTLEEPVEEIKAEEKPILKAGEPDTGDEMTKWLRNTAEGTKQCEKCGAVMRGWAYREPFQFCPKCGLKAIKAE